MSEPLIDPVLVVVDVQNGFVNRHSEHVLPAIARLIAEWTARGLPVVFTRYLNTPGSAYEKYFDWTRLTTSPEIDLSPQIAEHVGEHPVVDKRGYTLFDDAGARLVRECGWQDLVFCGIATESCVLKSAVDAFEQGYGPWIVTDACASDAGAQVHDAGLVVARRLIGRRQLITTSDLLNRVSAAPAGRSQTRSAR